MRTCVALALTGLAYLAASPTLAQQTRQLGPHLHGEGHLSIAVEGRTLQMELQAPGADIVGFESAPTTPAQRAAIAAATATLSDPIALFGIPAAAACTPGKVQVSVVEEEEDEDAQAPSATAAPGLAAPAPAPARPTPAPSKHTEFRVSYELTCGNLPAITGLNFAYFAKFRNAMELRVDLVTAKGAFSFEVPRAKPALTTRNLF
jgi:hypothetical protein